MDSGYNAIRKQEKWLCKCRNTHIGYSFAIRKPEKCPRNGNRLSKWANLLKLDAHAKLQMVGKFTLEKRQTVCLQYFVCLVCVKPFVLRMECA